MIEWLGFAIVLSFIGLLITFAILDRKQPYENLRYIPAFHKLKRGIGQAVEAGRKLHLAAGFSNLSDTHAGVAFASLNLLRRIAHITAISDQPPVSTSGDPVLSLLMQETARSAFQTMGEEDRYDPSSHQLCGITPTAYVAGTLPTLQDELVSVNVIAGNLGAEVGILIDAAERNQSLVVGGSDNLSAQAVLFASVSDPLIGEELFASGAYLKGSPWHRASLRTQDILRWVLVGFLIIGAVLKVLGVL